MVERYHYARTGSSAVVYAFGLFLNGDPNVWGVSWWIPAAVGSVVKYNPNGYRTTLVLHRLVIHPLVPRNGASFLLGRSLRRISHEGRYDCLLTYADTAQGHTGAIYKATNWHYEGLGEPTEVWRNSSGVQVSAYADGVHLSHKHMLEQGNVLYGKFAKHAYTFRLKLKAPTEQLALWDAA